MPQRYDFFGAIHSWDTDKARSLLAADPALVNERDCGETPLHWAARAGTADIARLLIDKGADVNAKADYLLTPYDVNVLGVKADDMVKDGLTPLHRAVMEEATEVAAVLIDAGANVNASSITGWTVLHAVAVDGQTEIARLLINNGADVNVKIKRDPGKIEFTPLHCAADGGRLEIAKLLLGNGADINAKDAAGQTPLHVAMWGEERKFFAGLVKLMIDNGADVNARDRNGRTPLHDATVRDSRAVKLLLDSGADVNNKDEDGCTPLHRAAFGGCTGVARLLIDKGADVNARDKDNRTPLHEVVDGGHTEVAEALIDKGAGVNVRDKDGETALGRCENVGCGVWPLRQIEHDQLADLLRKHGAKE